MVDAVVLRIPTLRAMIIPKLSRLKELKIRHTPPEKSRYMAAALGDNLGKAGSAGNQYDYPRPICFNTMMKFDTAEAAMPDIDFKTIKLEYQVRQYLN